MSGRHTGEQHSHTVEGTDPQLYVQVHEPQNDAGLRPGPAAARLLLLRQAQLGGHRLARRAPGGRPARHHRGPARPRPQRRPGGHGLLLPQPDPRGPAADRFDAGARPLRDGDPSSGLDVIGYSLGSRLAWEFGATQHELVHRLVLGGPNIADPLADFDLIAAQRYLADGTPIADESTAGLLKMAMLLPSNNIFALLSLVEAIKTEPYDPAEAVPHMPMLLVAGEKDDRAATMPELAALGAKAGAHGRTARAAGPQPHQRHHQPRLQAGRHQLPGRLSRRLPARRAREEEPMGDTLSKTARQAGRQLAGRPLPVPRPAGHRWSWGWPAAASPWPPRSRPSLRLARRRPGRPQARDPGPRGNRLRRPGLVRRTRPAQAGADRQPFAREPAAGHWA